MGSALDAAVNKLVRAALGTEADTIADDQLDKYVADLILKDAKRKEARYKELGVSAYTR